MFWICFINRFNRLPEAREADPFSQVVWHGRALIADNLEIMRRESIQYGPVLEAIRQFNGQKPATGTTGHTLSRDFFVVEATEQETSVEGMFWILFHRFNALYGSLPVLEGKALLDKDHQVLKNEGVPWELLAEAVSDINKLGSNTGFVLPCFDWTVIPARRGDYDRC